MAGALSGIRVVDLTQVYGGPATAMYLADHGADVIKVEPPGGDLIRGAFNLSGPLGGQDRGFLVVNRNKRGIVVDITKEEGLKILYKLIEKGDVLLHNFRPGVAERRGLGYEKLREINPRLIYVHLTPFGEKGPWAQRKAYDPIIQALSGVMGHRELTEGQPLRAGVWVADMSTPMMMAYAIALALLVRERTGRGQKVVGALFNQALAMQLVDLVRTPEEVEKGEAELYPWDPLGDGLYRCQDGRYLVITGATEEDWRKLCGVLGLEHLARDPAYDSYIKRLKAGKPLYDLIAQAFATKPLQEWLPLLETADLVYAPILSREEVFRNPQVLANQMIVELEYPLAGKIRMVGIPFTLNENPGEIRRPAPLLGEHTQEVLQELGYTLEQIRKLGSQGIVFGVS